MTINRLREEMETSRRQLLAAATARRDPNQSYAGVLQMFKDVSSVDRVGALAVVNEWLASEDEAQQQHAMAIVFHFKLKASIPILKEVSKRLLEQNTGPALAHREDVEKLIDTLGR